MNLSHIVIEKTTDNQPHGKNMLILGLSSRPKAGFRESIYQPPHEGEPQIVTGGYQLEPIPQYLASTVGLDHVLMIETEETRSIEEYFKNRLYDMENVSDGNLTIDEYRLTDPDKASIADVDHVVAAIQRYVNENPDVTIYLDMHGGLRSNTEILMTVFSMLPMEQLENGRTIRIDPSNIYSVVWRGADSAENRIIHAGEAYRLMDLAAGVHEFVEYGRTESLKSYAQGHESIRPMVDAMDTISDALAMADMDLFDKGLSRLKRALKDQRKSRYDGTPKSTTDTFIRLVDQEYGRIINSKKKQLEKIRWCMDKKFYQLAATMCESQIPWYLSEVHVLDFSNAIGKGFAQRKEMKGPKDQFLGAFNEFVNNYKNPVTRGAVTYYVMHWNGEYGDGQYYYLACDNEHSATLTEFLNLHYNIKKTRNYMNHLLSFEKEPGSGSGHKVEIYKNPTELNRAVTQYLMLVDKLHTSQLQLELHISAEQVC